jgi:hypothetical protein
MDDQRDYAEETANRAAMAAEANAAWVEERAFLAAQPERDPHPMFNGMPVLAMLPVHTDYAVPAYHLIVVDRGIPSSGRYATVQVRTLADDSWSDAGYHNTPAAALVDMYRRMSRSNDPLFARVTP